MTHGTPNIDLDNLVGYTFVKDHDGTPHRASVKEYFEDEGKFLVEFVNGGEELMNYNDLINIYNAKDDDAEKLWAYDKILDHRKAKGGKWEVKVLWDTGDEAWEPMQTIKLFHVHSKENIADILTKPLGPQQHYPIMKQYLT